jgi:hypothetical protein
MKCFVIPLTIGATGIVNKGLKEISGNNTRRTFSRFSSKDSCNMDLAHNKESSTV